MKILRLVAVALTTLLITVFLASPLIAVDPSLDKPNLDRLYQPRAYQCNALPELEDIQDAYNSIQNVPNDKPMRIPVDESVDATNPRERLVATGTINPSTGQEIPINTAQTRNMYLREAAIRERNCQPGFTLEQKEQFPLLASMDFTNFAQYETCLFVGAYGTVYDRCKIDLKVQDLNSKKKWIFKGVLIDTFCKDVMKAHRNGTWF